MPDLTDTLKPELSLDYYCRQDKRLGSGAQGTVFRYTYGPTGNVYAAKVLYYNFEEFDLDGNPKNMVEIIREQYVSTRLLHAHLIRAHKVFEYPEGVVIILPYCIYGHLGQLSLNSNQLRDAIRQILEALRHLHEQNYIHRDLKPTNILVRNGPEEHLDLAVADYGLVSLENPRTFCGSKPYMAPEIWSNNDLEESERILYCKAVDIYALGILILRMLRIAVPKVNTTTRTIFMTHVKSLVSNEMDECDSGDTERRDALLMADRMLQYDPENRPSVDECLRFPWLYHFTAAPLALGLSRTPSNRPMVDSPSNPAVARRTKDWWSSTQCMTSSEQQGQKEKQTRDRRLNKRRKQPEQSQPSSSSDKYKIQKRRRNPLPTPRSTPKRDQKSEGSIVNSPNLRSGKSDEISQDGITLLSWDKMEMSDGAV